MDDLSELVEKAISGDKEALLSLCGLIAPKIYFRVVYLIDSNIDAEDISQEVLYRVCDNLTSLKLPNLFHIWLNKIIMNEINRFFLKKARHGVLLNIEDHHDDLIEENEEFLPQNCIDRKDSHKGIMDLIKMLPERQKQVLLLHYYDGMNVTEIAETMGISKATVSVALKRARKNIKEEIESRTDMADVTSQYSIMPIGILLAKVFQEEAIAGLAASEIWAQQVAVGCEVYLSQSAAVIAKTAAFFAPKIVAPVVVAAAATASVAVTINLSAPAEEIQKPEPKPIAPVQVVVEKAVGTVLLEGGEEAGRHINPKSATALTDSEFGALSIDSWQISEFGSGAVLYSGKGSVVGGILSEMYDRQENGQYMLRFYASDATGGSYTIGSSFIISVR